MTSEERLIDRYRERTLVAAHSIAVLGMLILGAASATVQAAPVTLCDVHLRVELSPDVPNPLDAAFLSSLLGNHAGYRLTVEWQDPDSPALFILDLTGPGPEAGCREVVDSMREDPRVASIDLQQEATTPAPRLQPMGSVRPGPDGDWVLEPLNGVSYAQQARDRYECDIQAVNQTGFDPTKEYGGLPPHAAAAGRAEYLRAEAACFQARGYIVK